MNAEPTAHGMRVYVDNTAPESRDPLPFREDRPPVPAHAPRCEDVRTSDRAGNRP